MVAAAVELPVLVEVDEVDQQLLADGAREAGGVPHPRGASSRCSHTDVPAQDSVPALRRGVRGRTGRMRSKRGGMRGSSRR